MCFAYANVKFVKRAIHKQTKDTYTRTHISHMKNKFSFQFQMDTIEQSQTHFQLQTQTVSSHTFSFKHIVFFPFVWTKYHILNEFSCVLEPIQMSFTFSFMLIFKIYNSKEKTHCFFYWKNDLFWIKAEI